MRIPSVAAVALLVQLVGAPAAECGDPDGSSPDPDDPIIYGALIQQHYGRSTHRSLVIDASTIGGGDRFVVDDSFKVMLATALSPISDETIASYGTFIARESILEPQFETTVPWQVVSQAALDTIFSQCPRGWEILSERFPGCNGYVTLSRVGRNPEGDEALVYTEDHCGVLCGEGTFVYLRRGEEKWRVEKKLTVWVE